MPRASDPEEEPREPGLRERKKERVRAQLMEAASEDARASDGNSGAWRKQPNQLALSLAAHYPTLSRLREYIRGWRFYSAFGLAKDKIRQPALVEQDPVLREDAGNLSAVLHHLYTEHRPAFDELQLHLRATVPGFRGLSVKARGGPGQVIALWQEEGVDAELSLADLSDGTLHLLCWIALCLHPHPPSLICIDEPDQGADHLVAAQVGYIHAVDRAGNGVELEHAFQSFEALAGIDVEDLGLSVLGEVAAEAEILERLYLVAKAGSFLEEPLMSPEHALPAGGVIAGRYRIEALLGRGVLLRRFVGAGTRWRSRRTSRRASRA